MPEPIQTIETTIEPIQLVETDCCAQVLNKIVIDTAKSTTSCEEVVETSPVNNTSLETMLKTVAK